MGKRKKKVAPRSGKKTGRFCDVCGKVFFAVRVDAFLCSPVCRKVASRRRKISVTVWDKALKMAGQEPLQEVYDRAVKLIPKVARGN